MSVNIHASCVVVDGKGVLLLGTSGSGKSDLALRLLDEGAKLVADDRCALFMRGGKLCARAPEAIAGLLEMRGIGIIALPHVNSAVLALAVRLGAPKVRLPEPAFYAPPLKSAPPLPLIMVKAEAASATARIRTVLTVLAQNRFRDTFNPKSPYKAFKRTRTPLFSAPSNRRTSIGWAMIGLVLVTHGRLAQEFISAMEHMVGPQTHLRAVCIGPEDDIERRQREIAAAAKSVDMGHGVVIATDMFGGTPCNLALTLLERGKIEVLAGANLPSLIKLIDIRARVPLEQAVKEAIEAGRKYMRAGSADLA